MARPRYSSVTCLLRLVIVLKLFEPFFTSSRNERSCAWAKARTGSQPASQKAEGLGLRPDTNARIPTAAFRAGDDAQRDPARPLHRRTRRRPYRTSAGPRSGTRRAIR